MTISIKTVLLAGLASLSFAAAANAGEPARETRTVSYADLDLATPAGAKAMAARIRLAANTVCGGENRLAFGSPALKACRQAAAARAARQLSAPLVSAQIDGAKTRLISQR